MQNDFIGRTLSPGVPESDFLIVMATNDRCAGHIGACCHEVIATGTGEFRFDARTTSEIPYFQRAIMTAGHYFRGFTEEFGRHHLATVTGE